MLALIRDHECEVLVTDVCMPGRSGLDAMKEVKREHPTLPVLVLSVNAADQFGVQALKLGASGYLCKEHVTEELVRAIRKIVNWQRHITATLAEKLASHLLTESDRPVRQMPSVRERRETRQELHRDCESTGLGRWRLPSPALQAV
jgi:DNA-binding NarL/FixJ family response regulator